MNQFKAAPETNRDFKTHKAVKTKHILNKEYMKLYKLSWNTFKKKVSKTQPDGTAQLCSRLSGVFVCVFFIYLFFVTVKFSADGNSCLQQF